MRNLIILSGAAMVAACGGGDTETYRDGDGNEVTVERDGSGSEMTFRGADGEETTIQTGSDVATNLPDGFSVYPGANVVSTSQVNTGEGRGTIVFMETRASLEDVASHYRAEAEAAGVTISFETNAQDARMLSGQGEDGTNFSMVASSSDGGTSVQLTVANDMGG